MPTPASLRRRSILFAAFLVTLLLAGCHCDEPRAIVPPAIATCIAQDEMGSGRFGSTAANDVAWVRQIRYFDIDAPFVYEPNTDDVAFWSKPNHPPCYDRSPQIFQGLGGPLMYLGGPGGKNPVCAQKKPSP